MTGSHSLLFTEQVSSLLQCVQHPMPPGVLPNVLLGLLVCRCMDGRRARSPRPYHRETHSVPSPECVLDPHTIVLLDLTDPPHTLFSPWT